MTTVRLTEAQKRRLSEGQRLLEGAEGRRLTQGEAIEELAEFALRHREIIAQDPDAARADAAKDPLLDGSLLVEMGRTNPGTVDRVLYSRS